MAKSRQHGRRKRKPLSRTGFNPFEFQAVDAECHESIHDRLSAARRIVVEPLPNVLARSIHRTQIAPLAAQLFERFVALVAGATKFIRWSRRPFDPLQDDFGNETPTSAVRPRKEWSQEGRNRTTALFSCGGGYTIRGMSRSDCIQLLAGFFGTGLFYAGFLHLHFGGYRYAWTMLIGSAVCAAMLWGPVSRHED
jgi:hypothetical protein